MLQLFASEEHPGAEQHVGRVAVDHREQQVEELENQTAEVDSRASNLPWIPGLQHEPGNLHHHRSVCLIIPCQLCAVAEESDCRPEDCCRNGCKHHEHEQPTHFCQSDSVVSGGTKR